MERARGCGLHAVVAGVLICWASVNGAAMAQEGEEVTQDLGNSYLLARRTTSQGSIIETVLFAGQAIVTEIVVPAADSGGAVGTTGAAQVVRATAGAATSAKNDAANWPPGIGSGFGGTVLTGEVLDGYLVLHRTRSAGPVSHEVFREGSKVGSVTEVGLTGSSARLPGRNSFAFESSDDRFIVRLTQPDGLRISATTEHGRFSGQVVERTAAIAPPSRLAPPAAALLSPPLEPLPELVRPSTGRGIEPPQRFVRPQEPADRIMLEEPRPQIVPELPQAVPLPRPLPRALPRPAAVAPVQTASPSPPPRFFQSVPAPNAAAPAARPVGAPPVAATGRPVLPAAPAKPAVAAVSARVPAGASARPAAPAAEATVPTTRPRPAAESIAAQPRTATAVKPIAPASPLTAPAAASRPPVASVNPQRVAPSPARPARPLAPGLSSP
jgi:hypothetical protein